MYWFYFNFCLAIYVINFSIKNIPYITLTIVLITCITLGIIFGRKFYPVDPLKKSFFNISCSFHNNWKKGNINKIMISVISILFYYC